MKEAEYSRIRIISTICFSSSNRTFDKTNLFSVYIINKKDMRWFVVVAYLLPQEISVTLQTLYRWVLACGAQNVRFFYARKVHFLFHAHLLSYGRIIIIATSRKFIGTYPIWKKLCTALHSLKNLFAGASSKQVSGTENHTFLPNRAWILMYPANLVSFCSFGSTFFLSFSFVLAYVASPWK